MTGSLNIVDIAGRLGPATADQFRPAMAALAFLTVGISLKLALFPLHVWLPNAYAYAPSFATAFLAATATKVAVYLLLRFLFSVFGGAVGANVLQISELLLALSLAAMFIASILAVYEENLKRMLAYSSLAQIGYITFGISLANKSGLTGGRRASLQSRRDEGRAVPCARRGRLSSGHGQTCRPRRDRPQRCRSPAPPS